LPLRVNADRVMPVKDGSAIRTLPQTIGNGVKNSR